VIFEKKFKIAVSDALVPLNVIAEWRTNDTMKTILPGPIQTSEVVRPNPVRMARSVRGTPGGRQKKACPHPVDTAFGKD